MKNGGAPVEPYMRDDNLPIPRQREIKWNQSYVMGCMEMAYHHEFICCVNEIKWHEMAMVSLKEKHVVYESHYEGMNWCQMQSNGSHDMPRNDNTRKLIS